MYIVDEKLTGTLYATLCHCYRDVSFSLRNGKGYFSVQMTESEFAKALARAICEKKETEERTRILTQSYDMGTGTFQCYSTKLVTEREAGDPHFMSLFVGGVEYKIISVDPQYSITEDQEDPEESAYSVCADIADIVENTLVLCLYDYTRSGNVFRVFADKTSFENIIRHACAALGYVQEDDPDELYLDDDECDERADVGVFYKAL